MARKPQASPEIPRLIERIEASRGNVAAAAARLRDHWDLPARVGTSLKRHPMAWFGASLAVGWLATGRLFRRRVERDPGVQHKGLAAMAAAGGISLLKWFGREWLLRESRKRLQGIAER